MKTQTQGWFRASRQLESYDIQSQRIVLDYALGDYENRRLNKVLSDPCAIPGDGKYTWIKGEVHGEYVYGVKVGDGNYHFEVRYDEGPRDRAFMEEEDRKYILQLEQEGRLLDVEPNVMTEIRADHRYHADIRAALERAREAP